MSRLRYELMGKPGLKGKHAARRVSAPILAEQNNDGSLASTGALLGACNL